LSIILFFVVFMSEICCECNFWLHAMSLVTFLPFFMD
jgi:hypothetical protein